MRGSARGSDNWRIERQFNLHIGMLAPGPQLPPSCLPRLTSMFSWQKALLPLLPLCAVCLCGCHLWTPSPDFKVIAFYTGKADQAHISFVKEANRWFTAMAVQHHFSFRATTNWNELSTQTRLEQSRGGFSKKFVKSPMNLPVVGKRNRNVVPNCDLQQRFGIAGIGLKGCMGRGKEQPDVFPRQTYRLVCLPPNR